MGYYDDGGSVTGSPESMEGTPDNVNSNRGHVGAIHGVIAGDGAQVM
jgi:hypothetical protein